MVYWLGAYTAGRMQQSVYTYHKLSQLIKYQDGVKQGFHKLDKKIIKDYGKSNLSAKRLAAVDWLVCGVQWELPKALERDPQDRWGGLEDFEEDHDDDFEYYWECIMAAKEAKQLAGTTNGVNNNNNKNKNKSNRRPKRTKHRNDDNDDLPQVSSPSTRKAKRRIEEGKEEIMVDSSEEEAVVDSAKNGDSSPPQSKTKKRRISPRRAATLPNSNVNGKKEKTEERGLFDDSTSDEEEGTKNPRRKLKRRWIGEATQTRDDETGTKPKSNTVAIVSVDMMDSSGANDETTMNGSINGGEDDERKQPPKARPKNRPPSKRKKDKESKTKTSGDEANSAAGALEPNFNRLQVELREENLPGQLISSTDALPAVAALPSSSSPTSPTTSDKDWDDAIRSSLRGCTAFWQDEAEKYTEGRGSKRKALDHSSSTTSTTESSRAEHIKELKNQKRATEQVVHDAIRQWTTESSKNEA